MVRKTREKFIEVARQLFARKGVENTTMNDIASASDKGRRTIYTYFKSKREIFNAVIESESGQLMNRLRAIVAKPIGPDEKFREYLKCRMETMKEIVSRNGSLRAGFFRDVRKVDRARSIILRQETILLEQILREGVALGMFHVSSCRNTAAVISNAIGGLDVPYIRDNFKDFDITHETLLKQVAEIILHGIMVKED